MGDAPTTEEVREETERLRRELDGAAFERGSNERARRSSAERAMSAYALPIAEHRDALAAEVARLREALTRAEAEAAVDERLRADGVVLP